MAIADTVRSVIDTSVAAAPGVVEVGMGPHWSIKISLFSTAVALCALCFSIIAFRHVVRKERSSQLRHFLLESTHPVVVFRNKLERFLAQPTTETFQTFVDETWELSTGWSKLHLASLRWSKEAFYPKWWSFFKAIGDLQPRFKNLKGQIRNGTQPNEPTVRLLKHLHQYAKNYIEEAIERLDGL